MDDKSPSDTQQGGSWIPFIVLAILIVFRWIYYGEGSYPIRIRRWYKLKVIPSRICIMYGFIYTMHVWMSYTSFLFFLMQSAQLRNYLGYRDDSIYQSGSAGQGARTQLKRKG